MPLSADDMDANKAEMCEWEGYSLLKWPDEGSVIKMCYINKSPPSEPKDKTVKPWLEYFLPSM